ncbi:MAG: DUF5063 domain-containing protein, partial [Fulvivirga sp.]|nr:DUF5063 domain-containing protein [Fulvivirga sp.]
MNSLRDTFSDFINFISTPQREDKLLKLEKKLIHLYFLLSNLNPEFDSSKNTDTKVDYQAEYECICELFPELGYYHEVIEPLNLSSEPQTGTGDAADDLTDIVVDIKNCLSIKTDPGFEWQLKFQFDHHLKGH